MPVIWLKNECSRLGIAFPSNVSKPMLQEKLRMHYEKQALASQMEGLQKMQQLQQKNDEFMKDEAIDDQEGVICTICYEEYSDIPMRIPRLLPCGHTFCTDCVKGFIGQKGPNLIACPTCNKQLQLPRVVDVDACPVSKFVPTNFYAKDVSVDISFINLVHSDLSCRYALASRYL